jgi:hypothetical protein
MQKALAAETVAALFGVAGAAGAADIYSSIVGFKDSPTFAPAASPAYKLAGFGDPLPLK